MITEGEEHDKKLRQAQHIVSLLEGFTEPCTIVMSGNGDPLASSIMPPLIHAYRPGPQQEIKLFTNGLLIKKQLSDSPIAAHIKSYLISIDAGSAEVYEQVRLGGRWHILMENFDFLRDLAQEHRAQVALTMVLQRANHSDIANFAELCIRYDFAGSVTRLDNWGTWLDFANEDVIGNHHHAEHELAMQNLRSAYQQYRKRITFAPALAQLVKV
jgi:MoaA/NifB/PqqE/SkfB family radical SAM enzyme